MSRVNSGTLSRYRTASAGLSLPLGNEMAYAIVVHGGAGFHAHADDLRVKAALNRLASPQLQPDVYSWPCRACSEAIKVLQHPDGTALDAVEVAIRVLEDDGAFNAGTFSGVQLSGPRLSKP